MRTIYLTAVIISLFLFASCTPDSFNAQKQASAIDNHAPVFGVKKPVAIPNATVISLSADANDSDLKEEAIDTKIVLIQIIDNATVTKSNNTVQNMSVKKAKPEFPKSKEVFVVIKDGKFDPPELTIHETSEVTWINREDTSHIIAGAGFKSPSLGWGASYTYRFMEPGIYDFVDQIRPRSLRGSVTVLSMLPQPIIKNSRLINYKEFIPKTIIDENSNSTIHLVVIENYRYYPNILNISKGDIVIWFNKDPVAHTVTGAGFDSQTIKTNNRFFHVFNQSGAYPYGSGYQKSMLGYVVVKDQFFRAPKAIWGDAMPLRD